MNKPAGMAPHPHNKALRTVALLEAFKGFIVLIVGFGLLAALGHDVEKAAAQLVLRTHLNPAHHYPQIFLQAMSHVDDTRLWLMAGFAALYASIRFIEAYGLWHERRWAEWLAALSGGIYVPLELYEVFRHATWLNLATLFINLLVVAYMVRLLTENLRTTRTTETSVVLKT